jgi:hypothetical protein
MKRGKQMHLHQVLEEVIGTKIGHRHYTRAGWSNLQFIEPNNYRWKIVTYYNNFEINYSFTQEDLMADDWYETRIGG